MNERATDFVWSTIENGFWTRKYTDIHGLFLCTTTRLRPISVVPCPSVSRSTATIQRVNQQATVNLPRSVWLVRHGQADWNVSRRYMSEADRTLTAYGQRQAEALARFFAVRKIDVLLHTGLQRTHLTAEAIQGQRNITLIEDMAWREATHGDWEGLTYREVAQRFPDQARQRFADTLHGAPSGGESLVQMAARVQQGWQTLGSRFPGQRIVIVCHAGPIQALMCQQMGTPLTEHWRWRIDTGSTLGLDVYPGTTILRTAITPALQPISKA